MRRAPQSATMARYRQQLIGGVLGALLLGLGAWFLWGSSFGGKANDLNLAAGLWGFESSAEQGEGQGDASNDPGPFDGVYKNRAYGFGFAYPSVMEVGELEDAGGYVILARSAEEHATFQIFVLPWDEGEAVLTPDRIRQDLPDIEISNPQVATLPEGRQALIFESKEETGMATREVWLVHGSHLYQVTAPLSFDATLAAIMATWQFE